LTAPIEDSNNEKYVIVKPYTPSNNENKSDVDQIIKLSK
jgi:hypothetical protein